MNRYWDLTEKEKAGLTEDQVRALCDVELMEKGVLKPIKPTVMENPKGKPLAQIEMYQVGDLFFETLEAAMTCLNLTPFTSAYDSSVGWDYHYTEMVTAPPKRVAVCKREEVLARKSELMEYKAKEAEIKRQIKAYDEQCKAAKEACEGLWEDYWDVCAQKNRYQRIMDTLADYENLANGDKVIARQFLEKAFPGDDIEAATEWFSNY